MPPSPRVAVITRTRNRIPLLRRAMRSVQGQTIPADAVLWCLVHDGGESGPFAEVVEEARRAGMNLRVHEEKNGIGLVKALNRGLDLAAGTDYFCVHDDDDSWEPAFLEKTVAWLDERPAAGAVCTQVIYIEEDYRADGSVVEMKRAPFNPRLLALSIAEMAQKNPSPPISICARRAVVDSVGHYDERLHAMEDWDLMLRVMMKAEIGVIPETLANYHVRVVQEGAGSNTIHAGWKSHQAAECQIRDRYLREDMAAGRVGLGFLLAVGGMTKGSDELRRFAVAHNRFRGTKLYRLVRWFLGGRG